MEDCKWTACVVFKLMHEGEMKNGYFIVSDETWELMTRKEKKRILSTVTAKNLGDPLCVILSPSGQLELYDLNTDVGEENDIAEQHPDIGRKLKNDMQTANKRKE